MAGRRDHRVVAAGLGGLLVLAAACGDDGASTPSFDAAPSPTDAASAPDAQFAIEVRPGDGIGSVVLGMTYAELRDAHGEISQVSPFNRLVVGKLADGIEVLMTSAEASALSDDAVVIAVGLRAAEDVSIEGEPRPGMARAEVEEALGLAPESVGDIDYYPVGVSVEYDGDGVVKRVGVFAAYELAPAPPPMQAAP